MSDQSTYDEKDLMQLLKKGDKPAFDKIYQQYSNRLLGALIKLVKSESIASELLQDLFIRLWNCRAQIDADKSLRSYLFRIAENLAYDFFRKAARDKRLKAELITNACADYMHVEEEFSKKQVQETLEAIIVTLPTQRRQVFSLIKLEGKSYAEVSELLNISPSTINDHIVKATKFIRERISSEMPAAHFSLVLLLFL